MTDQKISHTPGPWYTGERDNLGHGGGINIYAGDYEGAGDSEEELIAELPFGPNARLIAAAPELLEAAENLIGLIGLWSDDDDPDPMHQAHLQLRRAIAKATE